MPVRKREGSPFFWYSFSINGCRFRGSTGHTEKSKAKEVERDQYQLAKKSFAVRVDWDLQTVLSTYWNEHAKDKPSAYAIEGNFADLQRLLGKGRKTSELSSGDLMDYRAKRRGERRTGKHGQPIRQPPKAHTINRELAYLHAAYKHCARYHRQPMPDVDWKGLRTAEPTWRKRFLSREDEAPALMAVLPANVREIVICAIVTGLRKGNILRLDWDEVNLAERTITVMAKGDRETIVKIPPMLMALLSTKPRRKGRVFDTTNFRKRWYAALSEAGLKNFHFHDLRHTFASWARKNGADLPTLKEAMNHSDISMTMRYANVEPDEVETAFDSVSSTLMGTIAGTETRKTAENGGKADD
jgi:integrase